MDNTTNLFIGAVLGLILGLEIASFLRRRKPENEFHNLIINKLNQIMATLVEFKAAFAEINEATTNIAADILRLTEQIGSGGLTAAEETEALNELKAAAEALKAVAATTPDGTPTPPVEEPPV